MATYRLVITNLSDKAVVRELTSQTPFPALLVDQSIDPSLWGGEENQRLKIKEIFHRFEEADGVVIQITTTVVVVTEMDAETQAKAMEDFMKNWTLDVDWEFPEDK